MAIIREGQTITWDLLNRDRYMRNKDAPAFSDDPITTRDIRGGIEVVSRSGNVMPRAITRDKLAPDALIFPMNINIGTSIVQVASGYTTDLNNYLFVAVWDGTNYAIYRFNTMNLLAPYQDAYILNTGLGLTGSEVMGSIDSISITDTTLNVAYTTNAGMRYMAVMDFAFTYSGRFRAPYYELSLSKGSDFDGKYLNSIASLGANVTDCQQVYAPSSNGIDASPIYEYQTFKTGPNTTKIGAVSFYIKSNESSGGHTAHLYWYLQDAGGSTIASGDFTVAAGSGLTWYAQSVSPSVTVTPNTTYRLKILQDDGFSAATDWAWSNANNYTDGTGHRVAGGVDTDLLKDFCFKIIADLPAGYSDKMLVRFGANDYSLISNIAWPVGVALPTQLGAYDGKFHYAYDSVNKNIVKFTADSSVVIATTMSILETVYGIMNFNEFPFVVALIGSNLVAIPVTI